MLPVQIFYPSFEANQVLASEHLNDLFKYLDEQDRLTRTNLIGIGIVCGMEPALSAAGNSLSISKGCGVTSEGYLIVWEDAAPLEWYRPYEVPVELPYREFEDRSSAPFQPFPMWELMADRNDDPTAVALAPDFLTGTNQPTGSEDEKILVLFLECLAESNRNCTPNSCNDKGTTVTATVRPLLVRRRDIDLLQDRIASLGPEAEAYFSLATSRSSRMSLRTLKLPRFDVSATSLASTTSVLSAFQRAMSPQVVNGVADALSDAYQAFQPILTAFPTDPFNSLNALWTFLHDGSIESGNLFIWYQYFYDHLDTVIQAYDEFRLKGLEMIGLCCPDSRLFPRHLMLGNIGVTPVDYSYRHSFVPSPLYGNQNGSMEELRLLFRRLVELVNNLELPPNVNSLIGGGGGFNFNDSFLRGPGTITAFRFALSTAVIITPSHLGKPLSRKAIPYHYQPDPLYTFWSHHLNIQGKADENLGYRSGTWNSTDLFVRFPLRYDLEPYNFLRIEGHIGQNFQSVLQNLLQQKDANRLPIDIVALKTGYDSDNIPLPEDLDACHFQDLDALYAAFREELLCQLCELVKHLYNLPYPPNSETRTRSSNPPRLGFLRRCAPGFRHYTATIGELYEQRISRFNVGDINSGPFTQGAFGLSGASLGSFNRATTLNLTQFFFFFSTNYVNFTLSTLAQLTSLASALTEDLSDFNLDEFQSRYNMLLEAIEPLNARLLFDTNDADTGTPSTNTLDLEELSDQLDHFLYACKLDSFRRIREEYERRLERIREMLLLSHFARKHPGLQHKAGVPLGGTFVMVYHGENQQDDIPGRPGIFSINGRVLNGGEAVIGINVLVVGTTQGTVTDIDGSFSMSGITLPARLRVSMPGFPTRTVLVRTDRIPITIDLADSQPVINPIGRFSNLAPGTVIADFYLPYLCCSDCAPVQFVLPKVPPTFTYEQRGCTDPNNEGEILISVTGGVPPYEYSSDSGATWAALDGGTVTAADGIQIQIRDSEGTESVRRTIDLLPPLAVRQLGIGECNPEGTAFSIQFEVTGGNPPYTAIASGVTTTIDAGQTGNATFASGQSGEVLITDSSDPACETRLAVEPVTCVQACDLPCDGITREASYPFWMSRNVNQRTVYQEVQVEVSNFQVFTETGQALQVDPAQLTDILNPGRNISRNTFLQVWNSRLNRANRFIQQELSAQLNISEPVLQIQLEMFTDTNLPVLRIERFDCHRFEFTLTLNFISNRESAPQYQRRYLYSQDGVQYAEEVFSNGNVVSSTDGFLPPFNVIIRDRCNPTVPERVLCEIPQDITILIERGATSEFQLFVEPSTGFPVLWLLEHGIPAMNSDPSMRTRIIPGGPLEAIVIVVDPDTTCASVATIEVPGQ